MRDINWNAITNADIEDAVELLTSAILRTAEAHIPKKVIRTRTHKPWVSAELRREMRKRDRLFKIAQNSNSERDWTRWRSQRNIVTGLNRKLKNEVIKHKVNLLIANKQTPYKYHKILKSITGFKQNTLMAPLIVADDILSDDLQKTEALNSYFCAQTEINITYDHLQSLREYKTSHPRTPHDFHFTPITPQEIMSIINGLDPSKACGSDGLTVRLVKMAAAYIAEPLSKLFTKSVQEGKYPTQWKKATVKAVFKGRGSPSEAGSYRPISLLPCLSKIFEKLMFARIYDHIHSNSLMTQKQSGYRPGHSTELQLAYLSDRLYRAMDSGNDYTVIYLDISRYFEKIWHEGLLAKCDIEFGIRGTCLDWLKSYLSGRMQIVQVGQAISTQRELSAGVPQGSVLGPLLAIMYLNGLSNITGNDMLFFADDSSLHASHNYHNIHEVERSLQADLDRIKRYGDDWAITFNADKTTQQTFTNKQTRIPALTFNDKIIPIRDSHKHLGVTMSTDLRFKTHVNNILLKFNRTLSPLFPIASLVPRQTLLHIYKMYIQPHIDYCDTIFDCHLTANDKSRLEKAQNRAARLITGTPRRTPTAGLRAELGWTTLHDRRRIHRVELYHKIIVDDRIPSYIKSIIPQTRATVLNRELRCTQSTQRAIPAARSASYARSIVPATTKIWNELSDGLRSEPNWRTFKKMFRAFSDMDRTAPHYFIEGSRLGNQLHTQIRLQASELNEHRYRLGKSNSTNCQCGALKETAEHFLLICPLFRTQRSDLFHRLTVVLGTNFHNFTKKKKIAILINGPQQTNRDTVRNAALAVQCFIFQTQRFINRQQ